MPSMQLLQITGFFSKISNVFHLKPAMKQAGKRGAKFVPIVVPAFCLTVFPRNCHISFFNITAATSSKEPFEILLFLISKTYEERDMLGLRPTMSIVQRITPLDNLH